MFFFLSFNLTLSIRNETNLAHLIKLLLHLDLKLSFVLNFTVICLFMKFLEDFVVILLPNLIFSDSLVSL